MIDIFSQINNRLSRLETGGKRNEQKTAVTQVQQTIVPGGIHTFRFDVPWDDANVDINPKGTFYWTAYLGSVHVNNRFPVGANGNIEPSLFFTILSQWYEKGKLDSEENKSHYAMTVVNNDFANNRTMIIRSRWVYIAGSTGTTAS